MIEFKEEVKYYFIYKTTNLLDGKIYIGQHVTSNLEDGYLGSGLKFLRVLKKYKSSSFKREIIEFCEDLEKLEEREIFWVTRFDSRNPEIGYNIHPGGCRGRIKHHSKESKEKNSKSNRGKVPWNKGLTKETNESLRELSILRKTIYVGVKSTMYGKHHSEETRKNQSLSHIGKNLGRIRSKEELDNWRRTYRSKGLQTCPYCGVSGYSTGMTRYHFDNCINNPSKINIRSIRTQEMRNKQKETCCNREFQTCPYCGLVGRGGNMKRYHFDNCKFKQKVA